MTMAITVILGTLAALPSAVEGKATFQENKCDRCHAIASQDIEATVKSESMLGPDLGELGSERDETWITQFVERRIELDGKKHRSRYTGSPEDLAAIAKWLLEISPD